MSKLNKDVLFLIFEELENDKVSLHSCLLVNRTWCETVVPIIWKNPGQYPMTNKSVNTLSNVILLHLSEKSRNTLKNQGINNINTKTYQRPLFNYINFWRYLDLSFVEKLISQSKVEKSNVSIIRNEILKLFINKNRDTKFIHLAILNKYKLHRVSGAEHCFSELESFYCRGNIDQNIIERLARICKSIKKIRFDGVSYCINNYGIVKLIEVQKKLIDVDFITYNMLNNISIYKSLEESLIRHADTIQYLRMDWIPITKILSYLPNLLRLEFDISYSNNWNELYFLKNFSLPNLRILKTQQVSSKSLANLIEITNGHLTEIDITYKDVNNERLIQAVYQNCPNLRYFKISLIDNTNSLISEFENLLINCKLLNGFIIEIYDNFFNVFSWDKFFIILAKSAPIGLFKFKFYSLTFNLKDFKLFFDNWKNRNPILITIGFNAFLVKLKEEHKLIDLLEKYKAKGIIKEYFINNISEDLEKTSEFEWN